MLTAYGYRGVSATQKQVHKAERKKEISKAVEKFTSAFRFCASVQHSEPVRKRHLTSVMENAADLGIWLFEQPCGFEFIWRDTGVGEILVSPAMVKVHDEQGRGLLIQQNMVEAVIARYM